MFCVESRCFFTSLMNENLFSCLISGGSFSHITVALYEIVCFPVFKDLRSKICDLHSH